MQRGSLGRQNMQWPISGESEYTFFAFSPVL